MIKGSLWSILGVVLSKGFLLITWFVLARILGKELYGEFGIIRSTIQMFAAFAGFGLGLTATKHVAEYLHHDKEKVSNILSMAYAFATLLGLIVFVLVNIFAENIAKDSLGAPYLENELRIASVMILISSLNGAQTGVLQGFKAFDVIAKINLVHGLISGLMFIFGAYFFSFYGAILALVLSLVLLFLLNAVRLRKLYSENSIRLSFNGVIKEKKLLLNYSLPAALCGLVVSPVKWIVEADMVRLGSGFAEMGIFQATLIFQILIMTLTKTINAPIITAMASNRSVVSKKKDKLNISGVWLISLFFVVPVMLFPEYLDFILGSDYKGAKLNNTLTIVMLYTSFFLLTEGLARVTIVENYLWLSFFNNLFWGIVLIISFKFLPKTSVGLSFAYLASYMITFVIFTPFYIKSGVVRKKIILEWQLILIIIALIFGAYLGFNECSFFKKLIFTLALFMGIIYKLKNDYLTH
ncbi:MAG: oligosaccharide flippase family protein [Winogradskyella sp.]|uniref:oligosaccharide flippase family protein n=1 Tax=Winogradskyella sp. TaxID=1883156 RepID=UPI0025E2FD04|nr:oligosaccharide flippase family protein [Winogradskyella sp.]NRB60106.1 oligosaccharide flippase family protein [Winogradskyella sp.]